MGTAFLTRTCRFASARRCFRPASSVERNREVFGVRSSPHGHGHNEVTVRPPVSPVLLPCLESRAAGALLGLRLYEDDKLPVAYFSAAAVP